MKHAKTWQKLHSTWTMFTVTCVVKHAFRWLVEVPCGRHVDATSEPHWRHLRRAVPHGNDFHPSAEWCGRVGFPPKSFGATVASDVATAESGLSTVASYVDVVRAMTWGAMSANFWAFRSLWVCSFWCPGQHMCVSADVRSGLVVFAMMTLLTPSVWSLMQSQAE